MQSTHLFSVSDLWQQMKIHSPNQQHEKLPEVKSARAMHSKYPGVPRCSCVTDKFNSVASAPARVWFPQQFTHWRRSVVGRTRQAAAACASAVSQSKLAKLHWWIIQYEVEQTSKTSSLLYTVYLRPEFFNLTHFWITNKNTFWILILLGNKTAGMCQQ